MIKSILPTGRYLQVSGSQGTMPYISSGNQSAGMLRLNTSSQNVEVYDGSSWREIGGGYVQVGLNGEAESLLDWARTERDRQSKREQVIKENPNLQKAMDAIKRAEENFDILAALVGEEQKSVT